MSLITMKSARYAGITFLFALLLFASDSPAQDLHPSRRASPIGIARANIGDAYVKVTYGRPYMRDRKIFGMNAGDTQYLVPFGEIWRTGANEATEITLTEDLLVDGNRLDAGTYAIFTQPDAETWTVHFSPELGLDGTGRFDPATDTFTPVYDPSTDVLAIDVPVRSADEEVDQFTITFEPQGTGSDMVLRWEQTEIRVPMQPAP